MHRGDGTHGFGVHHGYEVHHGYWVHHEYGVHHGYGIHHGYGVHHGHDDKKIAICSPVAWPPVKQVPNMLRNRLDVTGHCLFSRFRSKCGKCGQNIFADDLILRTRGYIFHYSCFSCAMCGTGLQQGDEYKMKSSQVICKSHFAKGAELNVKGMYVATYNHCSLVTPCIIFRQRFFPDYHQVSSGGVRESSGSALSCRSGYICSCESTLPGWTTGAEATENYSHCLAKKAVQSQL